MKKKSKQNDYVSRCGVICVYDFFWIFISDWKSLYLENVSYTDYVNMCMRSLCSYTPESSLWGVNQTQMVTINLFSLLCVAPTHWYRCDYTAHQLQFIPLHLSWCLSWWSGFIISLPSTHTLSTDETEHTQLAFTVCINFSNKLSDL